MRIFAVVVLAAITLAGPALSVADDQSTELCAQAEFFCPHPHSSRHVYGSPIGPPIVGHAKTSHRKHAAKSPSS